MPSETTTYLVAPIDRSEFDQETLVPFPVDLTACRKHDDLAALLPNAATADDMGLVTGTPGTNAPTLNGVDFGGTTSDEKCAFLFPLPPNYDPGETVTVRVRATVLTTVADDALTLDLEAWLLDDDGDVGSDLCVTSAQSINGAANTPGNYDFSITADNLVVGSVLMIRLSFAGNDAGDAGVMTPEISKISVLLDIRG